MELSFMMITHIAQQIISTINSLEFSEGRLVTNFNHIDIQEQKIISMN